MSPILYLQKEHHFIPSKMIDWGKTAWLNETILHWIVGFCVAVWIWKGLFSFGSVF
jgi:hypothetical protein